MDNAFSDEFNAKYTLLNPKEVILNGADDKIHSLDQNPVFFNHTFISKYHKAKQEKEYDTFFS